jgi:nucleotidyltransferase substrate binding protein (TIGR01987 family)
MIDTTFLERCILALEKALELLQQADKDSIEYDMYRSACIKEFEIILEQSGKLLKKTIRPYFSSSKDADKLVFKDIFRHAALHSLLSADEVDNWLLYRDNRNNTAHDYGAGFAESTLILLPQFITDSNNLVAIIQLNQP